MPSEVLVLGSALQISEPDLNGAACDFTPPVRWIFLQDFYDFRILDVQFSDLEYSIFNFDFCHGFFSFFQIIGVAAGLRCASPTYESLPHLTSLFGNAPPYPSATLRAGKGEGKEGHASFIPLLCKPVLDVFNRGEGRGEVEIIVVPADPLAEWNMLC